jgi:hypothetical protein
MFCGASAGLPLEWNGLRLLTRIGYGRAEKDYGKSIAQYKRPSGENFPGKPTPSLAPICCYASMARKFAATTHHCAARVLWRFCAHTP